MVQKVRSGIGVLMFVALLFLAGCGGGDGGGVVAVATPASALWLVADNTVADNIVTIFNAAPDNLYYNVHSAANPNGEIRGQLDAGGFVRLATLTGIQEVPQVITPAFGAGVLVVDNSVGGDNSVRGFVRISGVPGTTNGLLGTPTAVRIHNAARGVPGPAILALTGGPEVWVVPDNTFADNIVAIFNVAPDNLYFNVVTSQFANGEIRGQLDAGGFVRLATLDGAQETPSVTTAARGGGMLILDNSSLSPFDNNSVRGFIVTSGLTGTPTAAHIHNAARGIGGPIVVDLIGGPNLWVVPDNRISAELLGIFTAASDNLYFNVHTSTNPNGQIRGQLDASGAIRFATLSGAQETPPVTTAAFGGGVLSVDNVLGRVRGFLMSSGVTGTVAHVHNAARGVAGPIIVPLLPAP